MRLDYEAEKRQSYQGASKNRPLPKWSSLLLFDASNPLNFPNPLKSPAFELGAAVTLFSSPVLPSHLLLCIG
ncbi:hypothetical protein LINPERHAP1_LOCUS21521, partial [Linum perenne]